MAQVKAGEVGAPGGESVVQIGEYVKVGAMADMVVCWNTQDIEAVLDSGEVLRGAAAHDILPEMVTAVATVAGEGKYAQVYLCESSRPYAAGAEFVRVL